MAKADTSATSVKERKVTPKDFDKVADGVRQEFDARAQRRLPIEDIWNDIDRQLRQEPQKLNVDKRTGNVHPGTEWKPHRELSWQNVTRSILVADVMRLLFPTAGKYFDALPDDPMEVLENTMEAVAEDRGVVGGVKQWDIANLLEAAHLHFHAQYDHQGEWEKFVADCLTYSAAAGRYVPARQETFWGDYTGTYVKEQWFPRFVHYPIRNVYLDDGMPSVWTTSDVVGNSTIFKSYRMLADLKMRIAKAPKADGWYSKGLKALENVKGNEPITILEYEGDIVIPMSQGPDMFLPNSIVTVACHKDVPGGAVIRYQENPYPMTTWVSHVYLGTGLVEKGKASPYGTCPLMQGQPLQSMASMFFNLLAHCSLVQTAPPIQYDPSDPYYAAQGGPPVAPNALWPAVGEIKPHTDIGDPQSLLQALQWSRLEYEQVTETMAARIGAQTKSHQTAYAIDTELTRSGVRTVRFANALLLGPLKRGLMLERMMMTKAIGGGVRVYVPEYKTWLTITPDMLPEEVTYTVYGAAQPSEESLDMQRKVAALQMASRIDQLDVQFGGQPLNYAEAKKEILRQAFDDPERYTQPPHADALPGATGVPVGPAGGPAVPGYLPAPEALPPGA